MRRGGLGRNSEKNVNAERIWQSTVKKTNGNPFSFSCPLTRNHGNYLGNSTLKIFILWSFSGFFDRAVPYSPTLFFVFLPSRDAHQPYGPRGRDKKFIFSLEGLRLSDIFKLWGVLRESIQLWFVCWILQVSVNPSVTDYQDRRKIIVLMELLYISKLQCKLDHYTSVIKM